MGGQDLPEPKDWTGALEGVQHSKDAERQVVNLLADEIYRHLGCRSTAQYTARIAAVRRGTVDLYSDMGPCHSCRSVIKDFRRDFPALTLRIRYRNALRGGSSAALIPACDGLYGQYGIGDATQRADQLWAKTYPGNPVAAAAGTFDIKVTGPSGRRFTGTVRGIDQQPHSSYLYPAPSSTAAPLDEVAAVMDGIAQDISTQMVPERLCARRRSGSGSAASPRGPYGSTANEGPARTAGRRSRRSPRTSRRSASRWPTRARPRKRTAAATRTPRSRTGAPG
ncbi:hypothetical protein [Streptomyces sp. IBSBF 2390]|uniref:hypothetical protein n=1 Tax=Streptomyces sp. IBSBF 2390 TaxID=2903533 RepID=UPI002FDC658A